MLTVKVTPSEPYVGVPPEDVKELTSPCVKSTSMAIPSAVSAGQAERGKPPDLLGRDGEKPTYMSSEEDCKTSMSEL